MTHIDYSETRSGILVFDRHIPVKTRSFFGFNDENSVVYPLISFLIFSLDTVFVFSDNLLDYLVKKKPDKLMLIIS